jgi:glycosyltransferase involved in cell wall biosynthesis
MPTSAPSQPIAAASPRADARPRIVLIGNYPADRQESMVRFSQVMFEGLRRTGCHVELLIPPLVFGRWGASTTSGFGKWLGYIDKYLMFPIRIRQAIRARKRNTEQPVVVHICDHSNAIYTRWTRALPTVVTCHDLLAVRGAMGEQTDCPASWAGRLLQRWIVRGLARSSTIVSVSRATMRDVERIVGLAPDGQNQRMVHMGLNYHYSRLQPEVAKARLESTTLPERPFILHVGSNLRRKNRDGVLRIFAKVASRWNGLLVFAGEPLNLELQELAATLCIAERIHVVAKPETPVLEALYNRATALVFPSRFEGFGWPIIEAQACGCPVICSNATPLPEIMGDGGIICPLNDEEAFASAVLRLADPREREIHVSRGFANVADFTMERMIEGYLAVYEEVGMLR